MVLAEKRSLAYSPGPEPEIRPQRKPFLKYVQVAGLILSLFGFGLFYTYKHTRVIALGYEIEKARQNIAALQRENERLELEIAKLQRPERIEEIARTKLGMEEPEKVLLASLPPEPERTEGALQATAQNREKGWKRIILLVAYQFTGRAEASPR